GRERRLVSALTARLNNRCVVGVSSAPTIVASDAANSSHRKSARAPVVAPASTLLSTRLASRGAWNELAVRDTRTSALRGENASAMRRVRTPAIRAAYASVPIRLIAKVRTKSVESCASMGFRTDKDCLSREAAASGKSSDATHSYLALSNLSYTIASHSFSS